MRQRFILWLARHPHLIQSPITGAVSIACIFLGVVLVAAPLDILEPTSIGSVLPLWQEIAWAIMLGLGGVLSIVGIMIPHRAADCYGTLLIAGTLLIDAVAIISYRGFATGSITATILTALAVGLIVRAMVLMWISSVLAQVGRRQDDH